MIVEGQRVLYAGLPHQVALGDEGQVLSYANDTEVHTMWSTGAMRGQVTVETCDDLQAIQDQRQASLVDDSLEVGTLSAIAVRDVYDSGGGEGLLNEMADSGHLTSFSSIAEEALGVISSRIRQDPSFREVLGQLDESEGESLVRLASVCLIRDAFVG